TPQRKGEGNRVIVVYLTDPADLATEKQASQEDRMAHTENWTQQDRVHGLDDEVDKETAGAAELATKLRSKQNVDHTCNLRREPHHQHADEQHYARVRTDKICGRVSSGQ